ncbi:hypothetical protein [Devosia chinhatensis]|uniref:PD(D/E)XK endonuclease domain-containing protein n=1 Tax=Devosia chinhatensis TaxID=429727 RepID=A0A0F5FIU3_9HYPH|nr:hypothetical protein [Devosia chinhatensis]KKB08814.1 hypothetical protein VE26_01715 [Devosia chinhatensis]
MTRDEVIASAATAIFGKPLVTNVYRSVIVEAIIAGALTDWTWCSADYAEHDFINADGMRLEVKQSAMKQTWVTKGEPKPSWDIAPRKQVWRDDRWVDAPGRNADIYVLALHAVINDTADHREPSQWSFFVIPAYRLPASKRLSLPAAKLLVEPVAIDELPRAVGEAVAQASAAERFTWKPGDLQVTMR